MVLILGGVQLKRIILGLMSFMTCSVLGQSVTADASVKVYQQRSTALINHPSSIRTLNNSKVKYVKVPKGFTHMKSNNHTNEMRAISGKGVTFKTRFLLPDPGKDNQPWGNPQSIAVSKSGYMYIVYCPTSLHNEGRIVRYDMKRLIQLGVEKDPKLLQSTYVKHDGQYSDKQKEVQRAIKVGGLFDTGHGQSLAYNLKTHALYMWRDNETKSGAPTSMAGYIQHISASSLKPDRAISFHLVSHGYIHGGHTLTFDKYGNAYFWSNPGNGANIYKGRVSTSHVIFRRTDQVLRHLPGTHVQSMGYSTKRGRLYLISDDSIASFPAKQLNGHGSLKNSSFEWSELTPKRETEGLTFDGSGHGYLLVNHDPEVLLSTGVY